MKKSFRITNKEGIHARPATVLVNVAMEYDCDIHLTAVGKTVDFKSIMGVMSLGIFCGSTIEITTSGVDEEAALKALSEKVIELNLGKEI